MGARPLIKFLKENALGKIEEVQEEQNNEERIVEQQEETPEVEDKVAAFKQDYAKKLGWTTEKEWEESGRDKSHWRDYDDFLNTSPAYFEKLRKISREQKQRLERNAQATAAALEEERRLAREDAQREARAAAKAGDEDAAAAAVARAASAGPPPETVAWISRNPWFNEDTGARALAAAEVEKAARSGKSVAEQLQAAESIVKKRFPEYFEEIDEDELPDFITQPVRRAEPQQEVRMSESRKVAAAAASPNSGARTREVKSSKEKAFKDIPADDQKTYESVFARKFVGRKTNEYPQGMTTEQARDKYAKSYWSNKG